MSGGETRPVPIDVGPSAWALPDPSTADPTGLVGIGADLEPATLVDAYRRGIFPWPHDGVPLPWFSPDPRGVIPADGVRVSRSLRQRLRRCGWQTTVDTAFDRVVAECTARPGHEGTWITPPMQAAYCRLHRLGWARSVEVWSADGQLVGGLYGLLLGGVFTGESMFHRATDGSKVALVDLADRLRRAGASLIDVQMTTPHLASLGAVDVPRRQFLHWLRHARDADVELPAERLPVDRLSRLSRPA
jgi:leucyl/phenylalanyl-tRNA---protein transferase